MPQDVNPIIDRLCATFPALFHRQTPKPLKMGVGQEVLALAGTHPAFTDLTRKDLRRALAAYTGTFRYRQALIAGGPRYDLAGQPVGEVTPEQQALAQAPRKKAAARSAETTPPGPNAAGPPAPTPEPAATMGYVKMTLKGRVTSKTEVKGC
jgi:sRNA-binding protein